MDLYQAEWCPHSHRVRQRLTELGVDFVARQVAATPEQRTGLRRAAGTDEIPVLVTDAGEGIAGEEEILAYLKAQFDEREGAREHRAKALVEVPGFSEVRAAMHG